MTLIEATCWTSLRRTVEATLRRSRYAANAHAVRAFLDRLPDCPAADIEFMQRAIEALYRTHGQIRVDDLAAICCLSVRQFERRFKALLGVSPKLLARLIRFEAVRDHLLEQPFASPNTLAHDFGYTDQAHLIHDFKHIGGCAPGHFVDFLIKRSQGFYGPPQPRPVF